MHTKCSFPSRHHPWPLCVGDVPGLYFQHAPVKCSLCAGETAESVPSTCSGNASRIHIGDISPERSRYVAAMCLRYKWVIAQMSLIHWRYLAAMFPLCSWSVLGTQMTHPTCVPDITRNTHTLTHIHIHSHTHKETNTSMPIRQLMRKDFQTEKCDRNI